MRAIVALTLFAGCAPLDRVHDAPADAPYLVVLGTAQDGGLPQIACRRECCETARRDPSMRRLVSSVLLVDPVTEKRWLFDATPHLPLQIERARAHGGADERDGRPALFDGVFLTHAHMGHYTGLMQFGREAYGSEPVDIHGTERMLAFLQTNGPWSLLFDAGHANGHVLWSGERVALTETLGVTPLEVPHRDEFSDTVGFVIDDGEFRALFLPDIDKWHRWSRDLADVLASVDVALVDGTFYGPGELPGRAMEDVPHPFIVETMERLDALDASERRKVVFTHLNHSNPAADPASDAAREVDRRGYRIASEGEIVPFRR